MKRYRLEQSTRIAASLPAVFEFFSTPENLERITPESMKFRITDGPGRRLREGDLIRYSIRVFGIPMRWTTRIVMWRDGEAFADLQERGPYRYWLHTHTFRETGANEVEMTDVVEYELPFGFLGRLFASRLIDRQLHGIFAFRAGAIRAVFGKN